VEGSQPVGKRSFGFAQDDKLVRHPDHIILCLPDAPYAVIPTAVEGSQPVGRRSFGFAQNDRLAVTVFT
jgi:hypothetical protein